MFEEYDFTKEDVLDAEDKLLDIIEEHGPIGHNGLLEIAVRINEMDRKVFDKAIQDLNNKGELRITSDRKFAIEDRDWSNTNPWWVSKFSELLDELEEKDTITISETEPEMVVDIDKSPEAQLVIQWLRDQIDERDWVE